MAKIFPFFDAQSQVSKRLSLESSWLVARLFRGHTFGDPLSKSCET